MDKPHKKLDLWNTAMELAVTIYQVTDSFPREERYSLTDQIRRAVFRSLRKNNCGTVDILWSARVGQAPSFWLIWFVLFIWLVLFNQTNKTNKTNQMYKADWRTFSASC